MRHLYRIKLLQVCQIIDPYLLDCLGSFRATFTSTRKISHCVAIVGTAGIDGTMEVVGVVVGATAADVEVVALASLTVVGSGPSELAPCPSLAVCWDNC